ncbi:MAG: glucuronate isomerase [Rhodopirellula sp. JB044]|uniref:glucuronate isomerase n=1 Tax=Rhodopirellula sp. JB044 TaxID=3342844 RepID=UPI00370A02C7
MSDVFSQSGTARYDIYTELASLRLIDPHTHINPHSPASTTLADLLGYHYYTELAHSAGMPKSRIEDKAIGPKELVERLVGGLGPLENTVQYSWLIKICRTFFGFDEDRLHLNNWEELYDRSESIMSSAQWPDMVLDQSNVEAVFLTNDFDDDLAGFDTDRYIPCLRTDDLVFHLANPTVRERLAKCTGIELDGSLSSLRESLRALFVHFVGRGARACAISLPPTFTPTPVADGRATTALDAVLQSGLMADDSNKEALSRRVFWTLAELCDEFELPFDLMIGVNRKVYPEGVFQGQDLYDSRVSLIQYRELFNTFPDVKFPVSVLASVTNQELVSYAWIFPNVYPNGHWWYSNTPSTITHDLAARLEAVPQTKMIGYYSDAYKLEFVWPKFDMYRKVLAGVLADQFVRDQGWSIERAVDLGRKVLKENTEILFPRRVTPRDHDANTPDSDSDRSADLGVVATAAAGLAAAGASLGDDSDLMNIDSVEEVIEDSVEKLVDESGAAEGDDDESVIGAAVGATGLAAVAAGLATEATSDEASSEADKPADRLDTIEEPTTGDLADIELVDPAPVLVDSEEAVEAGIAPAKETIGDDDLMTIDSPDVEEPAAEVAQDATELDASEPGSEPDATGGDVDAGDVDAGESFDTVVMDPNFASSGSDSGEENELKEDEPAGDSMDDLDDDLGRSDGGDDSLATAAFDSAATVIEERDGGSVKLDESVAEHSDSEPQLDPLPAEAELNELDLDDVELLDAGEQPAHDAASIGSLLDDEPLDVGDLTTPDDTDSPAIQQLRGETSFAPDDDSLQLKPDPLTGELKYGQSDDSDPVIPQSDGIDDDNDEFNLSWLDEDDDSGKIEG